MTALNGSILNHFASAGIQSDVFITNEYYRQLAQNDCVRPAYNSKLILFTTTFKRPYYFSINKSPFPRIFSFPSEIFPELSSNSDQHSYPLFFIIAVNLFIAIVV